MYGKRLRYLFLASSRANLCNKEPAGKVETEGEVERICDCILRTTLANLKEWSVESKELGKGLEIKLLLEKEELVRDFGNLGFWLLKIKVESDKFDVIGLKKPELNLSKTFLTNEEAVNF